jgi:hypothetical protein
MGKRIPVVTMKHLQSNLPEDKVSPNPEDATPKKKEPESQPSPIVNQGAPNEKEQNTNQGKKDNHSLMQTGRERLPRYFPTSQGFFNGIVALFTAATCVVTYLQYTAQLLDQRAWVGVIQGEKPAEIIADVGYVWYFRASNSGKTPALSARYVTSFWHEGERFVPEYPSPGPGENKSVTVIQPGERQILTTKPLRMSREYLETLKSGTAHLYIYGQIQYDDIFGAIHCTMFCFVLQTDLQHLGACGEYNEVSDTKCENID